MIVLAGIPWVVGIGPSVVGAAIVKVKREGVRPASDLIIMIAVLAALSTRVIIAQRRLTANV